MGCAELPVLPGECPDAYVRRLEEWMDDLNAQNDTTRFLVTRAVKASWKMERGDSVEDGLIAESMINIAAGAEEADLKETERLAARLPEDPSVIRQMRQTPAGCRYILSELSILEQRLAGSMGLLFSQRHLLINLLGKRVSDVFRDDPVATRYVIAELSGVLGNQDVDPDKVAGVIGGGVPEGMSRTEYDQRIKLLAGSLTEKKEGNTKLKAYIAEVKTELKAHLLVIEELTEYKRAQAVRNARIDLGPQGKQLMQYQKKHEASFDSALRRLAALQKPQSPPPGPTRKPKKGKADAPTPEGQAPIPTQAHVAVTTQAPAGEPHANGQPTVGTNGPGATVESTPRTEVVAGTNGPGATVESTPRTEVVAGTNGPGATVESTPRTEVVAGTNGPGATVESTPRTEVVAGTNGPGATVESTPRTEVVTGTNGPGATVAAEIPALMRGLSKGPGREEAAIEPYESSVPTAQAHAGLALMRSPPPAGSAGG